MVAQCCLAPAQVVPLGEGTLCALNSELLLQLRMVPCAPCAVKREEMHRVVLETGAAILQAIKQRITAMNN